MSHEFESGFFVVKPPWHGLGTVLEDPPETASEAICAAGLNWTFTKEPLESVVPVDGTYRAVGLHDHYAIIRRKVENGIAGDDIVDKYLLLINSDNGSRPVTIWFKGAARGHPVVIDFNFEVGGREPRYRGGGGRVYWPMYFFW